MDRRLARSRRDDLRDFAGPGAGGLSCPRLGMGLHADGRSLGLDGVPAPGRPSQQRSRPDRDGSWLEKPLLKNEWVILKAWSGLTH